MYLHAVGWQIGKKDKIDLEGPKLKEKEGLYTCPPVSLGQKPFHCCLKVREEFIKVHLSISPLQKIFQARYDRIDRSLSRRKGFLPKAMQWTTCHATAS